MGLSKSFAGMVCRKAGASQHPFVEEVLEAACQGHLCLESDQQLPHSICTELNASDATFTTPIGKWGNRFYLQKNWKSETEVVQGLKRLIDRTFPALEAEIDSQLTGEQAEAVRMALKAPLMILSGGPGRGKTFTAKHIINAYPPQAKVVVAAPTGKAAHHLGASIEKEITCGTLHSLLHLHRETPKKIVADLLIVDECSMIDARVFAALLGAIESGTRVVLMGDPDQLPPVDAGTLFAQMCQVSDIPHVHLTKCLRSDRQDILQLADSINQGLFQVDGESKHLVFTPLTRVPDLHTEKFPFTDDVTVNFNQYRILCGLKRGPHGADMINRQLYAFFSGRAERFAVPILITRSDANLDIYNGETGVLLDDKAYFPGRDPLPSAVLPRYEYAYATTVHKSQGSEFDHVLLLLGEGSEQFGRQLLYTAVTRTRQTLEIVSTPQILQESVKASSIRESGFVKKFETQTA